MIREKFASIFMFDGLVSITALEFWIYEIMTTIYLNVLQVTWVVAQSYTHNSVTNLSNQIQKTLQPHHKYL